MPCRFAASRILGQAWADHALFPEEVRNYVRRLCKILAKLEIPADLINKPVRGYSLVFRATQAFCPRHAVTAFVTQHRTASESAALRGLPLREAVSFSVTS